MFIRRQIRPGVFFDDDAGGGGGFDSIDQLAAATDPANPANQGTPGVPPVAQETPAAAPPAPVAPPSGLPDPDSVPDDLLYKDAKELRAEVARARTRWAPLEKGLGSLDDKARNVLLEAAPALGDDAAAVMQAFAAMDPGDRAVMVDLAAQLTPGGDKGAVAKKFAEIATYLETGQVPGEPDPAAAPAVPNLDDEDDDDLPMTRAEVRAFVAQREQESVYADLERQVVEEARALGYDPDTTDPDQQARNALFGGFLARSPDGDMAKAHEAVTAYEQRIRDSYADGKRADAQRPGAPAGTGVSPTQERPVESMDDAAAAMDARLDAALGSRSRQ